jgi:transcriptional regulator with XRE-family HTH domain
MSINQRLKQVRAQLSKTQGQFAEIFEMTRENYAKIENNGRNVSNDMLTICHNLYGINLNWLITGSGNMKLTESVQTNIVNEPQADYGLKAAYEAQKELLKYKDEEIARLKECCKLQEEKDKAKQKF